MASKFVLSKFKMGSKLQKNAELDADFKSVIKIAKGLPENS